MRLKFPQISPFFVGAVVIFLLPFSGVQAGTIPVTDPFQGGPYSNASEQVTFTNPASGNSYTTEIFYPAIDGSLNKSGAPYPVVFVNHGFAAPISTLFSYGQLLASWGYVTIHPQRPVIQPSHDVIRSDFQYILTTFLAYDTNTSSQFYGLLDTEKVGVAGHSEGGQYSFLLAETDSRFKALVGLDPIDTFFDDPISIYNASLVKIPWIAIGTDQNGLCNPNAFGFLQYYTYGRPTKEKAMVIGGDHCSLMGPGLLTTACDAVCGLGKNDTNQFEITARFCVAWFNRFLYGERGFETYCWGPQAQSEVKSGMITLDYDLNGPYTPYPTQTPTSPPPPTNTPVPSSTPTPLPQPTSTPSPTPGQREQILMGGFWDTRVGSKEGGQVTVMARVTDPAQRIDLLYQGQEIGIQLFNAPGFDLNQGWYGANVPLGPGALPQGNYLLEIEASFPGNGTNSTFWPFLQVK